MIQYRLFKTPRDTEPSSVFRTDPDGQIWSIPFDPANTDYQNFKKQINVDEAQLEDADGNLMTDAKAFVATLP